MVDLTPAVADAPKNPSRAYRKIESLVAATEMAAFAADHPVHVRRAVLGVVPEMNYPPLSAVRCSGGFRFQ